MKRIILLLFLIIAVIPVGLSQKAVVRGKIVDKKSHQPIVAASLILTDGNGANSLENGRFTLVISSFPARIKVSHVSYQETEITLKEPPKADLVIEMEEYVGLIGEVEISGKRLQILTEKDDFSIQDFAFDHENLWLLGYTNNQASKGKIWLASWFGDTLASVPVKGAESLYRDVFGSVHMVFKDSVYQLYTETRKIVYPYIYDRKEFFNQMDPIRAGFAQNLVYVDINSQEQQAKIYCHTAGIWGLRLLAVVEDNLARLNKKLDSVSPLGTMWTEFASKYPVTRGSKISAMIEDAIKVPLFSWKDTLFIINLFKDSLLSYGPDGRFKQALPFTYCKNVMLNGIDGGVSYKKLTVLADPVGTGLFILERKDSNWILLPFNTGTGAVGQPVLIPEFPDMYNITVFGHAVYFLYPEKKYPFFVRLYRYQL